MRGWIESLARLSSRRPKRVVLLWTLAVVVSIGIIGALLPSALTTDSEVTSNPESEQAYDLLFERMPPDEDFVNELVIVHSPRREVDDPVFEAKVRDLRSDIEALGVTHHIDDRFSSPDLVSEDRHSTVLTIGMGPDAEENIEDVIGVVRKADGGDFETGITGEFTADRDFLDALAGRPAGRRAPLRPARGADRPAPRLRRRRRALVPLCSRSSRSSSRSR